MGGWAGWSAGRRVNGGTNGQVDKEPELASPRAPLISEDFPAPIFNKSFFIPFNQSGLN